MNNDKRMSTILIIMALAILFMMAGSTIGQQTATHQPRYAYLDFIIPGGFEEQAGDWTFWNMYDSLGVIVFEHQNIDEQWVWVSGYPTWAAMRGMDEHDYLLMTGHTHILLEATGGYVEMLNSNNSIVIRNTSSVNTVTLRVNGANHPVPPGGTYFYAN